MRTKLTTNTQICKTGLLKQFELWTREANHRCEIKMTFLDKLNYVGLADQQIADGSFDDKIKEFVDSLFGGSALDVIKYKYPKLNQSLNELVKYYELLDLDNSLDELDLKVEIAKNAYKLTNLDKKRDELSELQSNLEQMSEAKKRLAGKKEHLNRLMKKGNVIDNLKTDVERVKGEFKECYNKAKATEKVLDDIGFRSAYSTESMDKLREDILNLRARIESLEEFSQLFEGINSEHDLKRKINYLNEELKNYKEFFIKTGEENE